MRLNLDELNAEQRDAVTSVDGPIMILAGAGTGKTRVITYRLAYMLDCGIPASSIVALSFTNKAAKEMLHRVHELTGFEPARLEKRRDVVGYEWKRYELGDYITKTWYTYLIKTGESDYYKLRFIDFKKNGVRGYPTFEYYKL